MANKRGLRYHSSQRNETEGESFRLMGIIELEEQGTWRAFLFHPLAKKALQALYKRLATQKDTQGKRKEEKEDKASSISASATHFGTY